MKIGILEAIEDESVTPRCFRPKSFAARLVERGCASWCGKTTIRLVVGLSLAGIRQLLTTFEQQRDVWRPSFSVTFDPTLREGALRYPLLLARHQQSFAYSGAAYA